MPIFFRKNTQCKGSSISKEEKSVVFRAATASQETSIDEGIRLLSESSSPYAADALNLFYANKYYEDDEKWCSYINSYLKKFNISPIKLRPGNENKIDRIYTDCPARIYEGPKVTVIMPAFNSEKTVEMAARSILDQSWSNIELIIIDDASSDNTYEIIKSIAATDNRVIALRNCRNVGPYVSKNIALMLASGEFITGHDADDWAHPDRIYGQVAIMREKPDIQACAGYMLKMYPDGRLSHFKKIGFYSLDGSASLAFISFMFRISSLKKYLGAWDSVRFGSDSELIERAMKIFGPNGFFVAPLLTMFCLYLPTSLTSDPVTGINGGLSPARAQYVASWKKFHSLIQENVPFRLCFPQKKQVYDVHESARIDYEDVMEVLHGHGLSDRIDANDTEDRSEFFSQENLEVRKKLGGGVTKICDLTGTRYVFGGLILYRKKIEDDKTKVSILGLPVYSKKVTSFAITKSILFFKIKKDLRFEYIICENKMLLQRIKILEESIENLKQS